MDKLQEDPSTLLKLLVKFHKDDIINVKINQDGNAIVRCFVFMVPYKDFNSEPTRTYRRI
jgi:hypothetical protein